MLTAWIAGLARLLVSSNRSAGHLEGEGQCPFGGFDHGIRDVRISPAHCEVRSRLFGVTDEGAQCGYDSGRLVPPALSPSSRSGS